MYIPEFVVSEVNLVYFGGTPTFCIYCTAVKAISATTIKFSNKTQLSIFWVALNITVIWLY